MAVFANEGNASQDANFRRHLDDNWDSGNREFDKVEGLLNTLEENFNDYRDEIHQLQESFNNLKEQHTSDVDALTKRINELNKNIEKQDARITKLEDAVFNAVYINDTDELPTDTTPVSEDINDTHVVDDNNGVVIEESDPTLPHDIN